MRGHKFFKIPVILFLILILLVTLSSVYAEDNDNITSFNESVNDSSIVTEHENEDLLTKTYSLNGGSFDDIQKIVDTAQNGDTINLEGSFKSLGKEININKKLTITSSNGAILDGNTKSRVFNINSNDKGIIISNLAFKNAISAEYGGAIYLNAPNLVIDKCEFYNNGALSGGAISTPDINVHADDLVIKNSKFYSNHVSSFGGAILSVSKNLQITSCVFESNYAELKDYMGGGSAIQLGFENQDNNCTITDCTFNNNYITPNDDEKGHAGVACLRRGVTFNNCTFTNNMAYNYGVLGFHDGGTILNCKFYNNYAIKSGAALGFDPTNQPVIISNSEFKNNTFWGK